MLDHAVGFRSSTRVRNDAADDGDDEELLGSVIVALDGEVRLWDMVCILGTNRWTLRVLTKQMHL